MVKTKRLCFPLEVILVCIRWYEAYPLSYPHIEQMMEARGALVDHFSINRWSIRFLPVLEKIFRQHKRPVTKSCRMHETYINVKFVWEYLYWVVDTEGKTNNFLSTANRDKETAIRFFNKAMQENGIPEKVNIEKSGSNKVVIDEINNSMEVPTIICQVKHIKNFYKDFPVNPDLIEGLFLEKRRMLGSYQNTARQVCV